MCQYFILSFTLEIENVRTGKKINTNNTITHSECEIVGVQPSIPDRKQPRREKCGTYLEDCTDTELWTPHDASRRCETPRDASDARCNADSTRRYRAYFYSNGRRSEKASIVNYFVKRKVANKCYSYQEKNIHSLILLYLE